MGGWRMDYSKRGYGFWSLENLIESVPHKAGGGEKSVLWMGWVFIWVGVKIDFRGIFQGLILLD